MSGLGSPAGPVGPAPAGVGAYVEVPGVRGLAPGEALEVLGRAGLWAVFDADSVPAWAAALRVASQRPRPMARVRERTGVRLLLAAADRRPAADRPPGPCMAPIDAPRRLSVGEVIADGDRPDLESHVLLREAHRAVRAAVAALEPRQAHILRLRYGLEGHREHTLAAIGAALGLSEERVRQLERAAIDTLRSDAYRELLDAARR